MKNNSTIDEILKKTASQLNIIQYGVIKCEVFEEIREILRIRNAKGELTGFEEEDLEKRINPRLTMEDCKSIIVGVFPYYKKSSEESNLAKYTQGVDYHFVINDMMNLLGDKIGEEVENFKYMSFTDSGPLVDRYVAYKAGLGFWGVNGHIINEKYGSYILIGYMLTNKEFKEYNTPLENGSCMRCMRCVKVCPGGAIKGDYDINPLKCKSYITQKKEELTCEEENILRKSHVIFGCDICQDVCPHNKNIEETHIAEFSEDLIRKITEDEINELSNKKFRKIYGRRAFGWRGRKILERNMKIIKGE
ncbi:tRNA epoxyqueuosine(34) reductase QueG [Oceanirhabdus sp. W0125-5]|uniref:tRNA epoxyqueuosine(34) reductase QueG n=1 Tax=Oceanirhabdus sp. W0125-5 TaxID=2999116 RepID=UPI0022F2D962|nr:tRNA epoxyqueuosine(34) reductase QueG [Oceanirhabdus sp. W0125-5]WBW97870.1 tRNA epoxyqueuosine(34) reductase QueG [Oceanirhabdus sp. W0125-5]